MCFPEIHTLRRCKKIGATGILRGTGIPYRWANQTWFYPEREVSQYELMQGLRTYYPVLNTNWNASGEALTVKGLQDILKAIQKEVSLAEIRTILTKAGFKPTIEEQTVINRRWTSVLLDQLVKPFEREVDYDGSLKTN